MTHDVNRISKINKDDVNVPATTKIADVFSPMNKQTLRTLFILCSSSRSEKKAPKRSVTENNHQVNPRISDSHCQGLILQAVCVVVFEPFLKNI